MAFPDERSVELQLNVKSPAGKTNHNNGWWGEKCNNETKRDTNAAINIKSPKFEAKSLSQFFLDEGVMILKFK